MWWALFDDNMTFTVGTGGHHLVKVHFIGGSYLVKTEILSMKDTMNEGLFYDI